MDPLPLLHKRVNNKINEYPGFIVDYFNSYTYLMCKVLINGRFQLNKFSYNVTSLIHIYFLFRRSPDMGKSRYSDLSKNEVLLKRVKSRIACYNYKDIIWEHTFSHTQINHN